jgi:hypothetical protein
MPQFFLIDLIIPIKQAKKRSCDDFYYISCSILTVSIDPNIPLRPQSMFLHYTKRLSHPYKGADKITV